MEFTTLCYIFSYAIQFIWLLIWSVQLIWEFYTSRIIKLNNQTLSLHKSNNRILICFIFLLFIHLTTLNISINSNTNIYINSQIITELIIFWFILIIFLIFLEKTILGQLLLSTECLILFIFLLITGTLLLTAGNLLYVFFILELLGFIVLYSMFTLYLTSFNNMSQHISNILISLIYQFILNFVGSILFYFSLVWILFYHGSTVLNNLNLGLFYSNSTFWLGLILIALLIKFGTGPWICYKIKIYNNINFFTLSLYTIIYFGLMFIYFLNLIFIFNLPLTLWLGIFFGLLMSIAILIFTATVFQYGKIQLFLGLSSLLNSTLFLLQILIIVVYV